jgi:hemerythrin-like domain-containing protein
MDALTLLKTDHDKVKKLLNQLEATTERGVRTREELYTTIRQELTVHEVVEEEIFYPTLKDHPKATDIVLEGYEEHHVVDLLMSELDATPFDDETWGAKAKVMKENIEHHIEEEEGEMFPKARQVFSRAELEDLGVRMEKRKRDAMSDSGEVEEERRERATLDR